MALPKLDLIAEIKQELAHYHNSAYPQDEQEDIDECSELSCDVCGRECASRAELVAHQRHQHSADPAFTCPVCAKPFVVKENMLAHQRLHARPYRCTLCDRSFEHSGKLHRHMRIHTGERPHKCKVCSKSFIQSGQLVIHMRTHTGEKPYVCSRCPKGFTCSKQLKVHMRTHTGEKPYHCDICGKSFGYNHVLKLHQVQHFGCRVYKCTICNATFTNKKLMETHIISHDDGELPPRPTSTGSTASRSSKDRVSPAPVSPPAMSFTAAGALPCLLPSINTVCPDLKERTPAPALVPRRSIIARNPLYPVTMPLIKSLMAEDMLKFGDLPVLRSLPDFLSPSGCSSPSRRSPSLTPFQRSSSPQLNPLNLTVKATDEEIALPASPPPASPPPASSPTFANMTKSSLPLRKRRLMEQLHPRGSVIQFAACN